MSSPVQSLLLAALVRSRQHLLQMRRHKLLLISNETCDEAKKAIITASAVSQLKLAQPLESCQNMLCAKLNTVVVLLAALFQTAQYRSAITDST